MRMFKRICCASLILCLLYVLCMNVYKYVSADEVQFEVYPDGQGNFYLLENHRDKYVLTMLRKDGLKVKLSTESRHIDHVIPCADRCCLISMDENLFYVIDVFRKTEVSIIEGVNIKDGCITAAGDKELYLCDEGSPNEIMIYRNFKSLSGTVRLDRNIRMLFTDISGNSPYAVVDGGIYDVRNGAFIPCDVPDVPFRQNEGYYTDRNGSLYSFDSETGFTRLVTVDCESLCYMDEKMFEVRDGTIYMTDLSGNILSCFTPDGTINDMYSSGSSLVILSGGEMLVVNIGMFVPYEEEQISEASTAVVSSGKPDASEISEISDVKTLSPEVSEKPDILSDESGDISVGTPQESISSESSCTADTSPSETHNGSVSSYYVQQTGEISSSVYTIESGMITGVPDGTTIAAFKKNIEFSGYTVSFVNHNGKTVTSGVLGTGFTVDFCSAVGNESYTIVIMGDLTGEGNLNSKDILSLSKHLTGESMLDEFKLLAADINCDGVVDIQDLYIYQREYLSSGKNIERGKFTA